MADSVAPNAVIVRIAHVYLFRSMLMSDCTANRGYLVSTRNFHRIW